MKKEVLELIEDSECAKKFFAVKLAYEIGPYELNECIKKYINEVNIVDVRKYEDYLNGHIPFAIHVPANDLENHLEQFEFDKTNILYCYKFECQLAKKCCLKLAKLGYPVREVLGGFNAWQKNDYEIIKNTNEQF